MANIYELRLDMLKCRGRSWLAPDAHWCSDCDGLPIDCLTPEYDCCRWEKKTRLGKLLNKLFMLWFNLNEMVVRIRGSK